MLTFFPPSVKLDLQLSNRGGGVSTEYNHVLGESGGICTLAPLGQESRASRRPKEVQHTVQGTLQLCCYTSIRILKKHTS